MAQKVQKLILSFTEGLGLGVGHDVEKLEYRSIQAWDSVGHMQLVSQIEMDFDVMLETQDVIDMSSFGKAIEILKKYGVEFEV